MESGCWGAEGGIFWRDGGGLTPGGREGGGFLSLRWGMDWEGW